MDSSKRTDKLYTALYVRAEEGNTGRIIEELRRYLEEKTELFEAGVYADRLTPESGHPQRDRLISDARSGKISCIVAPELACFGENALECKYYIGFLFRDLNVRFIAIRDEFDSSREEDMEQLLSEEADALDAAKSYALSRKRCEMEKERLKQPDVMPNGSAPYGYQTAPEGKTYVLDEETAPFVRMMFKWALMGLSSQQIAQRMKLLGVGTPGQRRQRLAEDPSKWDAHAVLKILQNPNYTGDIYLGRMRQASYKSEARQKTGSEEWVVRKDTHEPLVSREDFDRVQEWIASNVRKNRKQNA